MNSTMIRFSLIFGAVAGLLIAATFLWSALSPSEDRYASEWAGYLVMIVALSAIFVGIKRYRDRELGGVIKFGQALMLGLGISLVASVVYVAGWELHLALTDHAFIEEYSAGVIEAKKEAGLAGPELDELVASMEEMKGTYAKPLFRMPMTFLEIFPVGLLVSLLSAAILRNRKVLPARAVA